MSYKSKEDGQHGDGQKMGLVIELDGWRANEE
jgi:hypothetical protein